MKVLVTGAPGWLGTRLIEMLRENNRQIRCLTYPGADDNYLKTLEVEVFKGDLSIPETLRGSCEGISTVFHCAGIIHPERIKDLYKINVDGTKNILEESIENGVERFIYVSSNSVGGISVSEDRLMEESDAPRPYKHYGISKYMAEQLVNRAFENGKIKTTIIRPCWFYGIRQPPRQTTFFKMIKKGNPIIFGNGNNLRSMSYIDNVVDALLLVEKKDVSTGKTYWIADKEPYPTIEIYETIAKLLEVKEFHPRFVPKAISTICELADTFIQGMGYYVKEVHVAGEMDKNIACSIKKAREELGYEPRIGLEEGMRRSIRWCLDNGIVI
jgi:nucleoside-diphosphate-sugar epimerase